MSSFPQVLKLGNLIGILFWEKRIAKWGHGWMADVWKSLRAICFHLQCIPSPFGVYAIWRPVQSQDSRGESAGNQFDYSASCCPLKIGVHNVSQCWLQYYCHVKLSVFHCHRKETLCIFLQKKCECEFTQPRLEQPASSLLWVFPELSRLMELLCMTRVHTWMKNFGHRLPKPSVLMSTVVPQHLQPLEGKWSKKMERAWARLQTKILMGITPIRNLILKKHLFLVWAQYFFSFTKKTIYSGFSNYSPISMRCPSTTWGVAEPRWDSERLGNTNNTKKSTTRKPCPSQRDGFEWTVAKILRNQVCTRRSFAKQWFRVGMQPVVVKMFHSLPRLRTTALCGTIVSSIAPPAKTHEFISLCFQLSAYFVKIGVCFLETVTCFLVLSLLRPGFHSGEQHRPHHESGGCDHFRSWLNAISAIRRKKHVSAACNTEGRDKTNPPIFRGARFSKTCHGSMVGVLPNLVLFSRMVLNHVWPDIAHTINHTHISYIEICIIHLCFLNMCLYL